MNQNESKSTGKISPTAENSGIRAKALEVLFRPADLLLGRLSLALKTIVVAIAVLIPLVFVLPPYLSVQNSSISFAQQEIVGLKYATPLNNLITDAVLGGYDAQRGITAPPSLAANVQSVSDADSQYGSKLSTTKLWTTAQSDLRIAESAGSVSPHVIYTDWNTAVNDLVNLMAQVGSGSNITLDPYPSTYFQGDIVISRTPLFLQNEALVSDISLAKDKNLAIDSALAQGAAQSALSTISADLSLTGLPKAYLEPLDSLADQLGSQKSFPAALRLGTKINNDIEASLDSLLTSRIAKNNATNYKVILEALLGLILAAWLVVGQVLQVRRSTHKLVYAMEAMAKGDLEVRSEVSTKDEFGRLSDNINEALERFQDALHAIRESVGALSSSSEEFASVGQQMSGSASNTATQAGSVSLTGEELSNNVQSVAASVDQLSAAISEISNHASRAADVASRAGLIATTASNDMAKLGQSGEEISQVVELITAVAEQTNLLALNATIEAARAGEAGRGFAVVASEVKELAGETTKATAEISKRIENIQTDTRSAVDSISKVREIIVEIDEIQASIAAAVEQQSATTMEIGRNASEAAVSIAEIANNATEVAQSANDTSTGASHNVDAAAELNQIAVSLGQLVDQFHC